MRKPEFTAFQLKSQQNVEKLKWRKSWYIKDKSDVQTFFADRWTRESTIDECFDAVSDLTRFRVNHRIG